MRDSVHPDNWEEWEARGFEWKRNGKFEPGQSHHDIDLSRYDRGASLKEREIVGLGLENVATGDPFDRETGRPVKRAGEYGIYWRPAEDQ